MTAALDSARPDTGPEDQNWLTLALGTCTGDFVNASLALVTASESGQLTRVLSAVESVRSALAILSGTLGPAARAGVNVPAADAAAVVRAHLEIAIYISDLAAAGAHR